MMRLITNTYAHIFLILQQKQPLYRLGSNQRNAFTTFELGCKLYQANVGAKKQSFIITLGLRYIRAMHRVG
jgi:hypothetical protein